MSGKVKVYVTGHQARFIPGMGTRQPGQYFEMPEDDAIRYVGIDGFGLTDPNAKPKPPRMASKTKTDEEA